MLTIVPGRGVGYFIFREGNVVSIVTTNLEKMSRTFWSGVLVEGGTLVNARTLKLERRQDAVRRVAPNHLRFELMAYDGTDGVQYTVNQGTLLRIKLELG